MEQVAAPTGTIDLLVVGGGPAGQSAVAGYREAGGTGRVLLVTADPHPPYQRPPLSKDYLRGETDEADLPIAPDRWYAEHDIGLLTSTEIVGLDPRRRRATMVSGAAITFAHCILATGSIPTVLPIPGAEHPDVRYLRSLDDARRLRDRAADAASAVVIGSGFIGCEAAASLAMRGLRVDLVTNEPAPQRERLGDAAGQRISAWLRDLGVRLHGAAEITDIADGRAVRLADGSEKAADLVLCATGATPRADLAESAGLRLAGGRVVVDADMTSSDPHIAAAGDIAFAHNTAAGRHLQVEHWAEAERMGGIAGTTAAGGQAEWDSVPGFWSEIGTHTLKYTAWGDGFDSATLVDHGRDGFTVWYGQGGSTVGVLTHHADDDYDRGTGLIERGGPVPTPAAGC